MIQRVSEGYVDVFEQGEGYVWLNVNESVNRSTLNGFLQSVGRYISDVDGVFEFDGGEVGDACGVAGFVYLARGFHFHGRRMALIAQEGSKTRELFRINGLMKCSCEHFKFYETPEEVRGDFLSRD